MSLSHVKSWLSQETSTKLQTDILSEVSSFLKTQLTYNKGWPARADKGHKMARFGDPSVTYTYKDKQKQVLPWTPSLQVVRDLVTTHMNGWQPNCVVVNTYAPQSGLYPHNDSKYIPQLGNFPTIVSVSFGETRSFRIFPLNEKKKRTSSYVDYALQHGDLFVMSGDFDVNNHHSIPEEPHLKFDRLSLTFRLHNV